MNRRLVRPECRVEACRETRPSVRRQLEPGTVVNILQFLKPETARFTIEGEGAEVWNCEHNVINEQTDQ